MRDAIWMVVADLREQSPFAKSEKSMQSLQSQQPLQSHPPVQSQTPGFVWHVLFHQKVCLWRLVQALHKKGQVFNRPPRYQELRRLIAGPEFKTVVFHRMVDIGRCAKREYYKWKCATVPVDLRVIWQDALSQHHLLQIQQKRCNAADRVRAATDFLRSKLYLAS